VQETCTRKTEARKCDPRSKTCNSRLYIIVEHVSVSPP